MARNHQARRPRGADDMQPHLCSCHIGPLGRHVGGPPLRGEHNHAAQLPPRGG